MKKIVKIEFSRDCDRGGADMNEFLRITGNVAREMAVELNEADSPMPKECTESLVNEMLCILVIEMERLSK